MRVEVGTALLLALLVGCGSESTPGISETAADANAADDVAAPTPSASECCTCDFAETRVYVANDDIPCSFEYPAHWEMSFDRGDNSLLFIAPLCRV